MRVTENHLIDAATRAMGRSRESVAETQRDVVTGKRVHRPSDDVTSWVESRRALVRDVGAHSYSRAVDRSRERLAQAEQALMSVGSILDRARELAVKGANDTLSADDRRNFAQEVRMLRAEALRQVNVRASDGEYVLAGTNGDAPAFNPNGQYMGNGDAREADLLSGMRHEVTVSGTSLTAASGVDVLLALDTLALNLDADSTTGIAASMDEIGSARDQLASALADVGTKTRALDIADDAREELMLRLARIQERTVDADAVGAAADLARAISSLEAARAVAARVISLMQG